MKEERKRKKKKQITLVKKKVNGNQGRKHSTELSVNKGTNCKTEVSKGLRGVVKKREKKDR